MTDGFARTITIDGRRIGPDEPPWIVAELSANHGGDLDRALRIIEVAAQAGCDAVKFQAYTADTLTLDSDMPGFVIEGDTPWKGRRLYELYAEAATPYDWFPALYDHARELGITPFASPFDVEAVRMLQELDSPAYKIASFEAVDYELIAACAATGKPIVVSTGMCEREEIERVLSTIREAGGGEAAIFRCNSGYPARIDEAHLLTIPDLQAALDIPVGFSDHTLGTAAATAACALGACMIEKHVIDAPEPPTPDSTFSAGPEQLARLVEDCRAAHAARGAVSYGASKKESSSLVFRRSIYAVADIPEGGELSRDNVRCIRPGYGLHPQHLPEVLGRTAARAIRRGEPLSWDLIR